MSYVGNTATTQSFSSGTDYFNGNSSTTAFTLSRPVASINDVVAVIENVVQQPSTAYTISGSTITFTSAPPTGTNNIYVRYMTTTTQVVQPAQNSVGYSSLNTDLQGANYGYKNKLINGAMRIDQRNAGASITPTTDNSYSVDRWSGMCAVASKYSLQQSSSAPTGYTNSLKVTSLSAYTVGAAEYFFINQVIEGNNMVDLVYGTSSAVTTTLSFWVQSSLTGTFGAALCQGSQAYPFSYTINSQNTWEYKTIIIPGCTTGTWSTTNTLGMRVQFGLGVGSNFSGTAGAWVNGNLISTTGATSVVGTSGATWQITGVQLEKGATATSFDYRPYGTELALCQRYAYYMQLPVNTNSVIPCNVYPNPLLLLVPIFVPVSMRATPSSTLVTQPTTGFTFNSYNGTASANQTPSISVNVRSGYPYLTEWVLTAGSNWGTASSTGLLTSSGSGSGSCILSAEL